MNNNPKSNLYLRLKYTFKSLKTKLLEIFLYVFGLIWLLIESGSVFFDSISSFIKDYGPIIFLISLIISIIISLSITIPKTSIEKTFLASNTKICIKKGNILSEKGNIAVTTSNYFDLNKQKQSSNSIKQQLIKDLFENNLDEINKLIEESLSKQKIKGKKDKRKTKGKTIKYKIGTAAVVPNNGRKIFFLILTKLNLDKGITESKLEYLQKGLNSLWEILDSEGNLKPISIPVFGSGLSKISLSRLIFIQLIVMSYVSYARTRRISRQLNIVINDSNYDPEEFYQIEKFLKSIEF